MELPPLHDDRWDLLLRAVLAEDDRGDTVRVPQPRDRDEHDEHEAQRSIEVPSGRRSSASS